MKKSVKVETAAVVTINEAWDMTPRGRKDVADWLRRTAADLVKHGSEYGKRFTARYRYDAKKKP
jgi:hypothetical protein